MTFQGKRKYDKSMSIRHYSHGVFNITVDLLVLNIKVVMTQTNGFQGFQIFTSPDSQQIC